MLGRRCVQSVNWMSSPAGHALTNNRDGADAKSMNRVRRHTAWCWRWPVCLSRPAAFPVWGGAHGPVAPIASSYLARVGRVAAGIDAKVIDGDLRMWLRVVPSETVVVLDYRGAPYLRFSAPEWRSITTPRCTT